MPEPNAPQSLPAGMPLPGYSPAQAAPEPRPYPPPPRRGLLSRLFSRGLLLALLASIFANISMYTLYHSYFQSGTGVEEKFHSGDWTATDKIAVIAVDGPILDGEGFAKKQIDRVREDEHVKAVVVRVDSPGGSVTASDQLYHALKELREDRKLPIVVSMGGLAASGGYYVSMAVGDAPNSIFVEPTTWTGSIGVIIPHYNVAALLKQFNIQNDSVKSHPLKDLGSFTKEMTAEERAILQTLVDDSFTRFKEIIKAGRPKFRAAPAELDKLATGQVFTAKQAIDKGLADREGFLSDAIDRAAEIAGVDVEKTRVIQYERILGFGSILLTPSAESSHDDDLAKLLDLATPRAYYMTSWLPPLAASR